MDRFVSASVPDFERLLVRATRTGVTLEGATYPPGCEPPSGLLRFRPLSVGGVSVEVEVRDFETSDFRLSALFSSGSGIFADPRDLCSFWRTAVAAAFGYTVVAEPSPPENSRAVESHAGGPAPPGRDELLARLARDICGQHAALAPVAAAVTRHLAKRAPSAPETILLLGPTGTGKTATVEALPGALADFCFDVPRVHRVDCNELSHSYDAKRFLGAAPGLVGYTETPPLVQALRRKGCIVLFDEVEKAHEEVRSALFGLLDEGRLTTPDGRVVDAPHALVFMTSNAGGEKLSERLDATAHDPGLVRRECRSVLRAAGWPPELIGRIGTFAVFEPLTEDVAEDVALRAVARLGREYDFVVGDVAPVLLGAVADLSARSGLDARALKHAARELLGDAFADAARRGVAVRGDHVMTSRHPARGSGSRNTDGYRAQAGRRLCVAGPFQ